MPDFLSVLCISMNSSNNVSFFLYLIGVASIAPASLYSITIMYMFPRADVFRSFARTKRVVLFDYLWYKMCSLL